MAVIKCKMCGGDLEIIEGSSVCECTYCGTKQTVPSADNEKKLTLFARAGRLLRACEFDKASGVFETIVADFPEEAEAYWGLVLCKYGIEYVDDPTTGKKIPTCHRSSFDSVLDDANFEQACENTDAVARRVYRDEARHIEELRQAILQVSGKEEPYDVFISYKETDGNGERTLDSVIAQDIYKDLTGEGYRVFFSRISLEDKLGTEYEPYIFAALNSAKVMIVVGTDYENFDSVWVKNEWSRFLKLIAAGQKKTLIPVFKNMDAYDMPKEFAKLAALDMGKVGAMQDLVRGVDKLLEKKQEEKAIVQPAFSPSGGPNVTALLERGYMALEDEEWDKSKELFDQVLNMDARNADAYLGMTLADARCHDADSFIRELFSTIPNPETITLKRDREKFDEMIRGMSVPGYLSQRELEEICDFTVEYSVIHTKQMEILQDAKARFDSDKNLMRAFRYAAGISKQKMNAMRTAFEAHLGNLAASTEQADKEAEREAKERFEMLLAESDQHAEENYRAALAKREADYQNACMMMSAAERPEVIDAAAAILKKLGTYRDSAEKYENALVMAVAAKKEAQKAADWEKDKEIIERYQKKVDHLVNELKHPSDMRARLNRLSLERDLKWYRTEIERLKKGDPNHE